MLQPPDSEVRAIRDRALAKVSRARLVVSDLCLWEMLDGILDRDRDAMPLTS